MRTVRNIGVLSLLTSSVFSNVMKGFHLNKGRGQIWSLPSDELKDNSSWFFDFEKYGNCLKLDVPVFKLQKQFSLCFKINHDLTDFFAIVSMISTKSGKSAITEIEENP